MNFPISGTINTADGSYEIVGTMANSANLGRWQGHCVLSGDSPSMRPIFAALARGDRITVTAKPHPPVFVTITVIETDGKTIRFNVVKNA